MYKLFNYDTSAYETASFIPTGLHESSEETIQSEIKRRIESELQRQELIVYYYRIGHTISFPLPVTDLPDLPPGIPNLGCPYPWGIWLTWELRERWDILYTAWKQFHNQEAGILLQEELAAIAQWKKTYEGPDTAGLSTGHLAAFLAKALQFPEDWNPELYAEALKAAHQILERDTPQWFEKTWAKKTTFTERDLHNIPCIVLTSTALLARTIGHSSAKVLDDKAQAMFQSWLAFCLTGYSEGTSYDGFFMDSLTQWMEHHPDQEALLAQAKPAFRKHLDNWIHHTLPGRLDLHAPLADVEPEMFFWMNVTEKLVKWYGWEDGAWLLKHIPPVRMASSALTGSLDSIYKHPIKLDSPSAGSHQHAASVTMRTGWDTDDLAVTLSLSNTETGHLHYDNGHLIIGHGNRFWITDPGYQQYRQGQELDFTIGPHAHNAPVISNISQSKRVGKLKQLTTLDNGWQYCSLDISSCYEKLPEYTQITRDVLMASGDIQGVIVRDRITASTTLKVEYFWQGGGYLAWAFADQMVRLSNEKRILWIGTSPGQITPSQVERHAGSRGPLTLKHLYTLDQGTHEIYWIFLFDENCGWKPEPDSIHKLLQTLSLFK